MQVSGRQCVTVVLRTRGLDYTINVDVTSYQDGVRRTHNSNRDGSTGRAKADEVRILLSGPLASM